MPVNVGQSVSTFLDAPPGRHQGVCVDVVDRPNMPSQWGPRDKVQIFFQLATLVDKADHPMHGQPYIFSVWYAASLGTDVKSSKLREFLESWRGRLFTEAELEVFDLERLLGANADMQLVHNVEGGKTYCNLQAIMAAPAGVLAAKDWVRIKDRPENQAAPPQAEAPQSNQFSDMPDALTGTPEDDDLPF